MQGGEDLRMLNQKIWIQGLRHVEQVPSRILEETPATNVQAV